MGALGYMACGNKLVTLITNRHLGDVHTISGQAIKPWSQPRGEPTVINPVLGTINVQNGGGQSVNIRKVLEEADHACVTVLMRARTIYYYPPYLQHEHTDVALCDIALGGKDGYTSLDGRAGGDVCSVDSLLADGSAGVMDTGLGDEDSDPTYENPSEETADSSDDESHSSDSSDKVSSSDDDQQVGDKRHRKGKSKGKGRARSDKGKGKKQNRRRKKGKKADDESSIPDPIPPERIWQWKKFFKWTSAPTIHQLGLKPTKEKEDLTFAVFMLKGECRLFEKPKHNHLLPAECDGRMRSCVRWCVKDGSKGNFYEMRVKKTVETLAKNIPCLRNGVNSLLDQLQDDSSPLYSQDGFDCTALPRKVFLLFVYCAENGNHEAAGVLELKHIVHQSQLGYDETRGEWAHRFCQTKNTDGRFALIGDMHPFREGHYLDLGINAGQGGGPDITTFTGIGVTLMEALNNGLVLDVEQYLKEAVPSNPGVCMASSTESTPATTAGDGVTNGGGWGRGGAAPPAAMDTAGPSMSGATRPSLIGSWVARVMGRAS